jgi:hypothetical protein
MILTIIIMSMIMAKKFEANDDTFNEHDMFKNLTDNYVGVSKIWDQSYTKLYKPWMDFMGESTGKMNEIPMDAGHEKYKEFYDDWMKTYQNSFGTFYPTQVPTPNETIENLVINAKESNKICMAWVNDVGENIKKTTEVINNCTDPVKYRVCLNMWRKSYEKMSEDLLALPAVKYQKEINKNLTVIPDFYSENFERTAQLSKESCNKIYDPWFDSMAKLSESIAGLSKGNATPDSYKEFYDAWVNTYKETFGKLFDPLSTKSSKEIFDSIKENINISLSLHKRWVDVMEKMAEKFKDQAKFTTDPESSKEFFNLMLKIYEKATDDFFERIPVVSPVKEMMEPIKNACKIYTNASIKMSKLWFDSYTCAVKTGKI